MSNVNSNAPQIARYGSRVTLHVERVDGDRAVVKTEDGFEFDVPRVLPMFLPSFPGESVTLRAGVSISAEFVPGTHDQITAALIEDDALRERPDFEGPREDVRGWCPYSNPQKPAGQE
jgi:hypothetical protein